jgi:hypothetical protein
VTRRSIILVVCGVLAVVVGLAVAALAQSNRESAATEAPAPVVEPVAGDGDTPEARDRALEVPEGTEAVAVELTFVAGGAGFVAPGDVVNVFALLDEMDPSLVDPASGAGPSTGTVGVLGNVTVLDVSTAAAARSAARTDAVAATSTTTTAPGARTTAPTQVTYLLAVPVAQVGDLVQAAGFHRLYVSVPAPGATARPEAPVTDAQLLGPGA